MSYGVNHITKHLAMHLSYITNGSKVCSLTYLQISYLAMKNVQWSDKFSKYGVKQAGFLTLAFLRVSCLHGNLPERVSICYFYDWVDHWLTLVWFRHSLPKPPSAGSCLSLSPGEAKGCVYFLFLTSSVFCFLVWSCAGQVFSFFGRPAVCFLFFWVFFFMSHTFYVQC